MTNLIKQLFVVLAVFITGCSTFVDIVPVSDPLFIKDSIAQGYVIGEQSRVFVGEPVLKIETAQVAVHSLGYALANKSFEFSSSLQTVSVEAGEQYQIAGKTNFEGVDYFIVIVPVPFGSIGLLVSANGDISTTVLNMGSKGVGDVVATGVMGSMLRGQVVLLEYEPDPSNAKLTPKVDHRTLDNLSTSETARNIELLYFGLDDGKIRFSYREFKAGNKVSPSFHQEVTFNKSSPKIRFQNYQIEVHEATGEYIEFTVVED